MPRPRSAPPHQCSAACVLVARRSLRTPRGRRRTPWCRPLDLRVSHHAVASMPRRDPQSTTSRDRHGARRTPASRQSTPPSAGTIIPIVEPRMHDQLDGNLAALAVTYHRTSVVSGPSVAVRRVMSESERFRRELEPRADRGPTRSQQSDAQRSHAAGERYQVSGTRPEEDPEIQQPRKSDTPEADLQKRAQYRAVECLDVPLSQLYNGASLWRRAFVGGPTWAIGCSGGLPRADWFRMEPSV
jgi:hypothetical protein